MRLPGICRNDCETVVFAHSNLLRHGKGMGLKADDRFGAYACFACHAVIDWQALRPPHLSRADVIRAFARGMERTAELISLRG